MVVLLKPWQHLWRRPLRVGRHASEHPYPVLLTFITQEKYILISTLLRVSHSCTSINPVAVSLAGVDIEFRKGGGGLGNWVMKYGVFMCTRTTFFPSL